MSQAGAGDRLVVLSLWLLVFASSSQTMIISPLLPTVGEELGIREGLLGTLVSVYSIMVGIFAVLAGPVSDRIGRRRILLAGTGLMALGLVGHLLVAGYASFMGIRILTGVAGGILSGAAVAYIGDHFPPDRRGWATGWVMSGAAFGQILGIPLGVILAGSAGFRLPFLLFGVCMAGAFVLIFVRLPQPAVARSQEPLRPISLLHGYRTLLREPGVPWAALSFFLMFAGISLYVVYLPTWLEREVGITTNQIGLLFLAGGVANVLIGPQAGRVSDRIGRKGIILASCSGLSVVMAFTTLVVGSFATALPYFFLIMALVAMRIGPFSALLTGLVTDDRRGSLLSLSVALGQVGFALGAALAGFLYQFIGYGAASTLAGVSVLAMGLMVWWRIPETRPVASPPVEPEPV